MLLVYTKGLEVEGFWGFESLRDFGLGGKV